MPGLNAVSINLDLRRFVDEEDLNRNLPGKENGNRSQQYSYRIFDKIVRHFDFLVDMHTASFGRVNSLHVRADMSNDTIAEMARLQDADILLNSKGPSAGAAAGSDATRYPNHYGRVRKPAGVSAGYDRTRNAWRKPTNDLAGDAARNPQSPASGYVLPKILLDIC